MSENERLAMKIERCEDIVMQERAARLAAESRAARLLTAMKHLLKAFLMLHRACGTGSAEQWPEVEDARAAIAADAKTGGE